MERILAYLSSLATRQPFLKYQLLKCKYHDMNAEQQKDYDSDFLEYCLSLTTDKERGH